MRKLQLADGKKISYLLLISIIAFASNLPRIAVGDSFVPTPTKTNPVVSVMSFGAMGNGKADDTTAIQDAMDSMTKGGTLEFPKGTYKYSSTLKLTKPNVKLWGYGATLTPTNVNSHAIQLIANNTHMYGFKKESLSSWERDDCEPHGVKCYSIVARAPDADPTTDNHEIIDNTVNYATGIFAVDATNVLIGRNTVYRTVADGIHITGNSKDVKVFQNTVSEGGDDMIAVVSYGDIDAYRVNNVLIEDNDVYGNYWARGISVVGSEDVTIRRNTISSVAHSAGILIYSEELAKKDRTHPPVNNVLVEDNTIQLIQVAPPVFTRKDTWEKSGFGGIHIRGDGATHYVQNVLVRNNVVDTTYRDGITVKGYVSSTGLDGNALYNVGRDPIGIIDLIPAKTKIACSGNTYNGNATSHPSCGGSMPNVTGEN